MGDKVIRISSNQGFSDSWLNTEVPTKLNLLDFTIPTGYNINLAESYIAVNTQINSDTAQPVNANNWLNVTGGLKYNVPNSALIRNCSLQNNRGQVENVRRVDTLKCALWGLEHDAETRKNNLNTLSLYEGGRGVGNTTSYQLDCVTNNVSNDGTTADLTNTSRNISRDLKIPLNDIFGCCNAEAYSTDEFGETRIKLETNFTKVKAYMLGGSENVEDGFDGATKWGAMVDQTGVANTAAITEVTTSLSYGDWQYTFPFFVGQDILVSATASGGASPANVPTTITAIQYQNDNTAAPPTGTAVVIITMDPPFYTNGTGGAVNITAILMKSKIDQVLKTVVNRADLVLTLTNEPSPKTLEFETWGVQEDNGNTLTSFNKGYVLEPEAKAVLVACCNNGEILPVKNVESYRYAIDNVEQTGNRDINMAKADTQGSPLQYERIQRCLDTQLGLGFRNSQLKYYNQAAAQAASYDKAVSVICETCEESQNSKMFNLNVECAAGLDQIILYKSISKTI